MTVPGFEIPPLLRTLKTRRPARLDPNPPVLILLFVQVARGAIGALLTCTIKIHLAKLTGTKWFSLPPTALASPTRAESNLSRASRADCDNAIISG